MRFSLEQHQTSQPLAIAVGNVIMVTPGTGATALVEYTTGSAAQIANYTATWAPWSFGTVSVATRDSVATAGFARVTTIGGPVMIDVRGALEELSVGRITTDAFGNPTGIVDPKGAAVSGGSLANITGTYAVGQVLTAAYPAGTIGTLQWTRTLAASPFTKTAISGAVASAVNSLAYTVTSADIGYKLGVDCSNQVSSATGSTVPTPANLLPLQQAVKLRANDLYTNGSSGITTGYYKVEFDAMIDSVQFVVSTTIRSGNTGTYKVQVASTDEIGVDTINKAFTPMRAGVSYNDSSANGWKDMAFGGAATKALGIAPGSVNNVSTASIVTDALPITPVARNDGKPGCILLFKVVQTDSAAAYTQEKTGGATWDGARGGSNLWFREFFGCQRKTVDGIASPTSLPTSVAEGNMGYNLMGYPIASKIANAAPVDLIMFTGDSRKAAAYSTYEFNNPARQAVMSLSSPSHIISTVDLAGSGHSQSQYLQVAMDGLNQGLRPTIICLPGFSQNGFSTYAAFKAANDSFMATVKALPGMANVKWILDTDYYTNGYAGTQKETDRQACITYAKSLANGSTIFVFDSDPIITDYTTTPGTPGFKTSLMQASESPNYIHANQAGQDAMTYGDGTYPGLQALFKTVLGIA